MADYYSPTVIGEVIPSADMTKLERLLLSRIFDAEPDGEGLYFHSWQGPLDLITLPRVALAASRGQPSQVLAYVEEQLARARAAKVDANANDDEVVELDLSGTSWEFILQDIVRRSATLRFITVMTAFTCSTSRHREQSFIVTSEGAERAEIIARRPLGDRREIGRGDVLNNIVRNFAQRPEKQAAMALMERAAGLRRGTVQAVQKVHQAAEARGSGHRCCGSGC